MITFADNPPEWEGLLEQEHHYYLRCPICGKVSGHESHPFVITTIDCRHCKSSFIIEDNKLRLYYDGINDKIYEPF
jgi:hypothetical protein